MMTNVAIDGKGSPLGGPEFSNVRAAGEGLHRLATRHATSLFGAALVTVGLLVTMQGLIAEEFSPQDVADRDAFVINPVVEDIVLITERMPPKSIVQVEVPPPPPKIDIVKTALPSEPITSGSPKPEVLLPKIPISPFDPVIADTDPTPIVRVPPAMPPRAAKSGHCRIAFDISADGRPFNVQALSCSESLFSRPAIRSVEKWTYSPEIRNGQAITRKGLKTTIRFNLTDEAGRIIPE